MTLTPRATTTSLLVVFGLVPSFAAAQVQPPADIRCGATYATVVTARTLRIYTPGRSVVELDVPSGMQVSVEGFVDRSQPADVPTVYFGDVTVRIRASSDLGEVLAASGKHSIASKEFMAGAPVVMHLEDARVELELPQQNP